MSSFTEVPVLPPKPKRKTQVEHDIAEFLPKPFHSLALIGKRMSGKTSLLTFCIDHPHGWGRFYKDIIIISPSIRTDPQWETVCNLKNVLCAESIDGAGLETILQTQKAQWKKSKKNTLLLILDDLSSTIKNKKTGLEKALNKYWSTARHWGVSCCITAQTTSHLSTTIRTNCTNIFAFRMSEREMKMLSEENASLHLDEKSFVRSLKEATRDPYSFFNINWQTNDPDMIYGKGFRVKSK
jgi:hypothetical protein